MSRCPTCGSHVPFGGGKTVRNAAEMMETARFLEANLDNARDDNTRAFLVNFIKQGRDVARWLHDYGHKRMNPPRDQVMPYFISGGEWMRQARVGIERSG
jgi:hypothetical protein